MGDFVSQDASDESSDDTSRLVAQFKDGDVSAFESIYRAYVPLLANVAISLTYSRDLAEDAVQEIFLRLWQSREQIVVRTNEELRFYLLRALRNRLISDRRHDHVVSREERLAVQEDNALAMGAIDPHADDLLIAAELDRALAKATARMPPRMRMALMLRLRHQMTNRQIGDVLDLGEMAAAQLVSRARKRLREIWERHAR